MLSWLSNPRHKRLVAIFVGLGVFGILIGLFVTQNWAAFIWLPPGQHCAGAGMSDYGDAPEGIPTGYPPQPGIMGSFPSSNTNSGANANVQCNFWLGEKVTGEADYTDPADPDPIHLNPNPPGPPPVPNSVSDYDDGIGWVWRPDPNAGPVGLPTDFIVQIEIDSNRVREDLVANVLMDLDMNGNWSPLGSNGVEWVIMNYRIPVVQTGHQTVDLPQIRFPVPGMTASSMPECFWMRVAITNQPIEIEQWAGTGLLGEGEIEDVLIHPTPVAGDCRSSQPVQ
jgi:hypothetical protein